MTDVEVYMEAQIQALLARVTILETENSKLSALHSTPGAAASDADSDDVAGDAAQVVVDPTTNSLRVSAAAGAAVQVAPVLKLGNFPNMEHTLVGHALAAERCSDRNYLLEKELILLQEEVATLSGQ